MSRFKRCEIQDCDGIVSKSNPIIVRLHSTDEGFGHFHSSNLNKKIVGSKCPHCGETVRAKVKDIKLKICKDCLFDLQEGNNKQLLIDGVNRLIESFDGKKNIAFYTLFNSVNGL